MDDTGAKCRGDRCDTTTFEYLALHLEHRVWVLAPPAMSVFCQPAASVSAVPSTVASALSFAWSIGAVGFFARSA